MGFYESTKDLMLLRIRGPMHPTEPISTDSQYMGDITLREARAGCHTALLDPFSGSNMPDAYGMI